MAWLESYCKAFLWRCCNAMLYEIKFSSISLMVDLKNNNQTASQKEMI